MEFNDLDEYQMQAGMTAIYPKQHRIIYPMLGLVNEAGEVAGKLKKMMRDEGFTLEKAEPLTLEQEETIVAEMGDVLWYLATLATDLNVNLSDIARYNLDKLFDRKERGVLGGSGDER